jgi:hypothetical protein
LNKERNKKAHIILMSLFKGRKSLYNMIFLSVLLLSQFNLGFSVQISPIYELAQTDSTTDVKNVLKSLFASSKSKTSKPEKSRLKIKDPKAIDEIDLEKLFDSTTDEVDISSKHQDSNFNEMDTFAKAAKQSKPAKSSEGSFEFKRDKYLIPDYEMFVYEDKKPNSDEQPDNKYLQIRDMSEPNLKGVVLL